jgi:hypothetical protein
MSEDEQVIDNGSVADTNTAVSIDPSPSTPEVDSAAPSQDSPGTPQTDVGSPSPGTPMDTQAPAGTRPAALPTDPLKELNDFKAQAGRERAEMQRQLQQFQTQQQQWQAEKQRQAQEAERLQLKRWDPKHPEHSKFSSTMAKKQALTSQLQALRKMVPPDQYDAHAQELVNASLSPTEQAELQDHHQMNQEFLVNPVASAREQAREVAREMIREAFAGFQQHTAATQDVQRDLGSIPPQALPFMKEALESGASYDVALKMAGMAARLNELEGRSSQANQTASIASEQARLSKSRASITRDPRPAPMSQSDIYNKAKGVAQSQGINTSDSKFSRILAQIEEQSKSL